MDSEGSLLSVYMEGICSPLRKDHIWIAWSRAVIGRLLVPTSIVVRFHYWILYDKVCKKLFMLVRQ